MTNKMSVIESKLGNLHDYFKEVKLEKLTLKNFKGIKEFELNADGYDLKVFANNGLGKTTVADSYSWLLSGKDSLNNATNNMGIKTKDENDQVIHRLEHVVEGIFLVDGQQVTLKKIFKEIWRKKTGELTEKHTGHTTLHFIDDAPVKEKEYNEYIDGIIDKETLPLLIDLWHFNEVYDHKKRRKLLFEIIGDITDEEIMNSSEELRELPSIIESRSVEKHMEKVLFEQKSINKRIEEIPSLIRENIRNMPDLEGITEETITADIDKLSTEIEKKTSQIHSIKNGLETNEIKKKISDIDLQIANVRNEHVQDEQQSTFKLKTRLQEEQSNLAILQGDVKGQMQQKKMNEQRIKDLEGQVATLREQYKENQGLFNEQNALEFNHEDNCFCPTCDQELPEDKISDAVANFNRNKAKLLESTQEILDELDSKGPKLGKEIVELEETNESIQKDIDKITEQGKKKTVDIEKLEQKIKEAESTVKPVEENEKYNGLIEERQVLEDEIRKLEQSVESSVVGAQDEIANLKEKQKELQVDLAKLGQVKAIEGRNKELEVEQKEKSKRHEELERQKYLINKFTKTKVSMVEGSINKHFKYVNFKLFEELVNGALRDVCIVTFEGKTYGPELNEASRFNASLDVINTLSKHFGVQLPLFIDKAESVTKFIDTDTQLITLVVSEKDKQLRIEKQDGEKDGAA